MTKWPVCALAALALPLLAASCVPDPYATGHRPAPGRGGSESSAFRGGQNDGSRDKRQGRRYHPYARQGRYPAGLRDDYVRGYDTGYRQARDDPWNERRAFELGQSHGRHDRRTGQPMNPDRHLREVPRQVRDDYRGGYRAGYGGGAGRPYRG